MGKSILMLGMVALFILPMVGADTIEPGYKQVSINNKITNINEFADFVFIAYGDIPSMCPPQMIESDGEIGQFYKFCGVSVYAVKKSEFDSLILANDNDTLVEEYFNSSIAVKVISGISTSTSILEGSAEKFDNVYTIDMNNLKTKPDNQIIKRNYLFYVYIILPVLALLIIIFVLVRRRK